MGVTTGWSNPEVSLPFDHPREECGVVGVYAPGAEASRMAFFGIFALQHRGQESAGIATADGKTINIHTDMGLVTQVFRERDLLPLTGEIAIGHTRYSTTGVSRRNNAQPFLVDGYHGRIALAHNGNITNPRFLKDQILENWNCTPSSSSDSEIMAYYLANAPGQDWVERLFHCMRNFQGAYSMVALTRDTLIAARDPLGMRPLCLGKLNGGWVIASESCALDPLGATYIREVEPGEVLVINQDGLHSAVWPGTVQKRAMCVFELIYFARPDSIIDQRQIYEVRRDLGMELAAEHPVDADLVIGIPDSSTAAAMGYANASGIPYSDGLIKNRYIGRTFIEPEQRLRDLGVRQKFSPLGQIIQGKRLVVVDDSIVRGTTTPHVVSLLRRAGAREIHMRVCAPPIKHPCFMGVDMATRQELIAANKTVEEIRQIIGADTLGYLSVAGLMKVVRGTRGGFCDACFTGNYPVPVQLELTKLTLEDAR